MSEWPDPYAALPDGAFDKAFDVAEALADRLEADGWICGHPYREDVTAVISKLYLAGLLVPAAVNIGDAGAPSVTSGEVGQGSIRYGDTAQ